MTATRSLFAMAAALGLAACAATAPGPDAAVGPEPSLAAGVFSTGGGLVVAASLREVGGRAAFCGVWARGRQSVLSEPYNRDVLATGAVFLDGDRIVQGLAFLPEVALAPSYVGAPGRCVITERAWGPGLDAAPLIIRLPRQTVANESAGGILEGDGGIVVRFRQVPFGTAGI